MILHLLMRCHWSRDGVRISILLRKVPNGKKRKNRNPESRQGRRIRFRKKNLFLPNRTPYSFFFTPSRIFQRIPWVVHPRKRQWQNLRRVINPRRRNSRKKSAKKKGKGERKFKTPWRVLIIKRRNHRGRKKRGKSYNPPVPQLRKSFVPPAATGDR